MTEENYDYIFKVLLLGNSDVGKSSLLLRFVDKVWTDSFVPTIGVDFKVKTMQIGEKTVKMQIWDTAGQERFRNVVASYFRGSNGILLIYDVTNKDSFKNLDNWLEVIENNASDNVLKILIGNKIDLVDEIEVKHEEGQQFANRFNMQFIETSAKLDTNVSEAFETLAKLMIECNKQAPLTQKNTETKKLGSATGKDLSTKKKCC